MGGPPLDTLRISPKYTSQDWFALDQHRQADWSTAAAIVRDRLEGRFLRYASNSLRSPYSGFAVLAIDSLVMETLEQFRAGDLTGTIGSGKLIKRCLARAPFQPDFHEAARDDYYKDIRCGLLHQAEANRMWLVRRDCPRLLEASPDGNGYIIDVRRMHKAVKQALTEYLREIRSPDGHEVRHHLWHKMSHISNVRVARGLAYGQLHPAPGT